MSFRSTPPPRIGRDAVSSNGPINIRRRVGFSGMDRVPRIVPEFSIFNVGKFGDRLPEKSLMIIVMQIISKAVRKLIIICANISNLMAICYGINCADGRKEKREQRFNPGSTKKTPTEEGWFNPSGWFNHWQQHPH